MAEHRAGSAAIDRPRSELRLNWRREALHLAAPAAQTCLVIPWVRALSFHLADLNPLALSLFAFATCLVAAWLVRAMSRLKLSDRLRLLVSLAGLLAAIGVGLTAVLNPGVPPGDVLRNIAARITAPQTTIIADVVMIGLAMVSWWLGLSNAQRLFGVDATRAGLHRGIFVWVLYLVFNTLSTRDAAAPFVAAYFLFALIASALGRSEDLTYNRLVNRSPFGVKWFAATCLTAVALVALSLLAWAFVSQALVDVVWAVIGLFTQLVLIVAGLVSALIGQILTPGENAPPAVRPPGRPAPNASVGNPNVVPPEIAQVIAWIIVLVAFVAIVVFIIRFSQRDQRHDRRAARISGEEENDGVRHDLMDGLSQSGGRVRRWLRRLRQGPSRWLAALTIRRIYAQTVVLGAECGAPRPSYDTPYEHLPALLRVLAGVEPELRSVTEAYVRAHYGELPDTPEHLAEVRVAFERIRAEAKTVIEYNRSEFAKSQEELKGEIKSHLRQGQLPGTH